MLIYDSNKYSVLPYELLVFILANIKLNLNERCKFFLFTLCISKKMADKMLVLELRWLLFYTKQFITVKLSYPT